MTPTQIAVGNAVIAAVYALLIWGVCIRPFWPYDIWGRRKTITLKPRKRWWD